MGDRKKGNIEVYERKLHPPRQKQGLENLLVR
jgi:hypothetical protein